MTVSAATIDNHYNNKTIHRCHFVRGS